jgi:hypothetical protein
MPGPGSVPITGQWEISHEEDERSTKPGSITITADSWLPSRLTKTAA